MAKILDKEELKRHIIDNGITKVRLTRGFWDIPVNTELYIGIDNHSNLSSYDSDTICKNKDLGLDYEYIFASKYRGKFELIEESLPNNFKIQVSTEELSKKVQEHLFELGYGWVCGGVTIQHHDSKFLFVNNNLIIRRYDDSKYFLEHKNEEITLTRLFNVKPEKKKVIMDGKEFYISQESFEEFKKQFN
jgi:hypothetical protein